MEEKHFCNNEFSTILYLLFVLQKLIKLLKKKPFPITNLKLCKARYMSKKREMNEKLKKLKMKPLTVHWASLYKLKNTNIPQKIKENLWQLFIWNRNCKKKNSSENFVEDTFQNRTWEFSNGNPGNYSRYLTTLTILKIFSRKLFEDFLKKIRFRYQPGILPSEINPDSSIKKP